jgi:hypothetical protein
MQHSINAAAHSAVVCNMLLYVLSAMSRGVARRLTAHGDSLRRDVTKFVATILARIGLKSHITP